MNSCHPYYLVSHIVSKSVIVLTASSLHVLTKTILLQGWSQYQLYYRFRPFLTTLIVEAYKIYTEFFPLVFTCKHSREFKHH